jgi:ABC-2 type transport system ATP-binding protein
MSALAIRNLKKTYDSGLVALRGIDLEVGEGEFFGLLGPNGAGKTTTINVLTSLVRKSSGTVKIFGHDIDVEFAKAKRLIGLVPQEFNFSIFEKVRDIVIQQAGYYGIERKSATARAEHYLRQLDLWEKRNVPARELSGGMKRRLMIARALVHEPKLLILDEPTAGVDVELRRSMWQFLTEIHRAGRTIILTTHYLEEAEQLCERIGIINHGELIADAPKREMLRKLDKETFVLDILEPRAAIEPLPLVEFLFTDPTTLEVTKPRTLSLNEVFAHLARQQIIVESMRNKSNRLEELFMELVEQ